MTEDEVRKIVREEIGRLINLIDNRTDYWRGEPGEPLGRALEEIAVSVHHHGYEGTLNNHRMGGRS